MEKIGNTPDISMFLIFLRCRPLCAVLIVVLDSESSGSREWQPAVLIALPAQKMKFLMRQVSICCQDKSFTMIIHSNIHGDDLRV